MKCKKWLALSMAAAMFLSMATGVFAAAESPSEIVTVVSDEKPTFSAGESTRNMPYEIAGSAERMSDTENKVSDRVTFKSFLAQGSVTALGTSGKCGDNVSWNFDVSSGKLTLSGSGKMTDYDIDKNSEPGWRSYAEQVKTVVIGNGITTIGDQAFAFCSSLQSVSISDTVTSIGAEAFVNCVGLQSAPLPKKLTTIKKGAFDNCIVLTNVVLPETVETIEGWAFEDCYKITSLHIPKNVKSIGDYAFAGTSISKSTVDDNNPYFSASDNVIFNKNKTKLVYYACGKATQNYTIPGSVTEIGNGAFGNNSFLTSVTIPSSAKRIGIWAFANCHKLKSAKIPDSVTEIGYRAFYRCQNLTECNIPKSLTSIESGLFEQCHKMKAFSIPNTVKKIDNWAFRGCSSIEEIEIPASVESIEQIAFCECSLLRKVILNDGIKHLGSQCFFGTALTALYIPSSVTQIDTDALDINHSEDYIDVIVYGVKGSYAEEFVSHYGGEFIAGNMPESQSLSSQSGTFPSGQKWSYDASSQTITVTGKGDISWWYDNDRFAEKEEQSAFNNVMLKTKHLIIGEGIDNFTSIYDYGYWDESYKIETLSLPSTFNYREYFFSNLFHNRIKEYKISDDNPYYRSQDGVIFNKTMTTLISYPPQKSGGNYTIPNTVNKIAEGAFLLNEQLDNISIPSSVTEIGERAFSSCWSLTTITIPNSVTSLGYGVFSDCDSLYSVVIGNQVEELDGIFSGCKNLAKVYIPKSVTRISNYTFVGCTNLPTITVDSDNQAYSSVNGILFNKSQKTLLHCPAKKTGSYVVPSTVATIEGNAFADCQLTSVTIPKTVTSLGWGIFYDSKVSHIYYAGTQQQWKNALTDEYGNLNSLGKDDITIHYNSSGPSVTAVTIKSMPTKKTYTVGESFAPAGMILKATYDDGTAKEITSGFTYTPTGKLTTAGQQKIVVSYGGKSTGFYVTVNEASKTVSSVTIAKKPTKQTYTVGESFNAAGMKLKVTYTDSTTAEITSGFTYTPTGKLTTAGQQKIVVSYGGKSTGFYVTVNKAVSSVTIAKKPTKQTYTVGESFNSAGMKLKVTYADNTTAEITSGFTYTPTGKLTTAGQQKIVVSYGGKSTGFYVTVNKAVSSVTIAKKPTRQTYTVGESFNAAGMKLKVTYADNTTSEITSGFTCTPSGKLNTAGQQKIVVSYGGKSTGFYVTVNEASKTVSSVTMAKKPTKQTYTVGETFNAAGMKLKVTYADNTTAEVTSGFTYTPTGKLNTAGQQKIVVSYGGKSTGFYVTVNKAVSSVTIAKKPTKQTYTAGESFNAAGMKLKVTYADNTTSEITSGFTYTPTGKLTTMGQQKIVVTYGGKSTGFYVTVE